ncbi:MAG: M28 family peptidase [Planctomycetes bacterium]|nr:M28 family peptidase [Planctomycetota bacterium]
MSIESIRSPFRPLLLASLLATATSAALAQDVLTKDRSGGAAAVDVAQCKEWLGTLAGPEFEGRGTGQPGFEKAADYVAAHFQSLGLVTYFQHVPWASAKVEAARTSIIFKKGNEVVLTIPADKLSGTAGQSMAEDGDAVLLVVDAPPGRERGQGGGGEVPAIAGLDQVDLAGKVAIVHVRQPKEGRPNPFAAFAVQQALADKKAKAVVFATAEAPRGGLEGRRGGGRRANPAAAAARRQPGSVTFGGDTFTAFLTAAGLSKEALATAPVATSLPLQASVAVTITESNAPAMNVWAVLPGSDPQLRHEYVVIGSHLDHLGRRGDTISPGADDDGSGTTGVMAVSKMFARNETRPARSILFVCFSGEENGLVGSAYFADNCPIPLSSIAAELQMDMIGRDEEENMEGDKGEKAENNRNTVHLVGTKKLSPELHELCMQKNATAKFDIEWDQEGMFGRSDHANFANKGVPIAFFFTGLHRDYHQPSDTPDKINYEKLLRIATWVYDIGFELATQTSRPQIDPELWAKYRQGGRNRSPEQPAAPLKPAAAGGANR